MRLIDADKLKRYIDCGHLRSPTELCFSELNVIRMLDRQPTVDVEPVRRGFWNWNLGFPYCSECKKIAHKKGFAGYHTSDYCPNCGAKMKR